MPQMAPSLWLLIFFSLYASLFLLMSNFYFCKSSCMKSEKKLGPNKPTMMMWQ
uniref:ATP synthase complex subunit 8 n=1 Tax=Metacrangonyx dhofarensis TaxID=2291046 RepID=A0A345UDK0_9CRUS|nr:ATP synthase F0 subunit 8 [Metacrangonyx dhofarensis]